MQIKYQNLQLLIRNSIFWLQLDQRKIIQTYYKNWKQVLEEQLTGININQKYKYENKTNIEITLLIQVFREQIKFLIYYVKLTHTKHVFPTIEIKDHKVMVHGRHFFSQ